MAVAALVWSARNQAGAARRDVDRARAHAAPEDVLDARPLPYLRSARSHFASAHRRLSNPAAAPLRILPVLGRQLRAVDAMAQAGSRVSGVGATAVSQGQAVLRRPHGTGPQRIDVMRALADLAERTRARLKGVGLGPSHALVGPVAHAHDTGAAQLTAVRDGLDRAAAAGKAGADLLAGPRRYLLLAANNAEMRAGSGMWLSAGVLETHDGRLSTSPFRATGDVTVPAGAVPATGDLAALWGWMHPTQDFRFLAATPRFDLTAPLAARMWEASGGGSVDGVLVVDPEALRAILEVVGPVDADGRTVSADDVVDWVLHDQYLTGDPFSPTRREAEGSVARAAVSALDTGDWSPSRLARALSGPARGRHVLAWSRDQGEEAAWASAGVDGVMRADDLMASVMSTGGNKLDYFLDVSSAMDVRRGHGGWEVSVRFRLRNPVPPDQPFYVAGPAPGTGLVAGEYRGLVSVSLPGDADYGHFLGRDTLAAVGPDGPNRVVAAEVHVMPGQEQDLEVRFNLPGGTRGLRLQPSARIPAVPWDRGARHWSEGKPRVITWG